MRFLVFFLVVLISMSAFPQKAESSCEQYPFQVVYAENAKLADGTTILGRYDYVSLEEQIVLDSGFLILMHCSEKLYEFNGDTTISISQLIDEMPDYLISESYLRPNIVFFSRYREDENGVGGITYCLGGTYIFIGFSNEFMKINIRQPLLLQWKSAVESEIHDYTISVRNIYDQLLERQVVHEPKFLLEPNKYKPVPPLCVIQVFSNKNPDDFSVPVGVFIDDNIPVVYIPEWDSLSSPIDHLQAWFYFISRGNYYDAFEYLDRLEAKSNHPFYQNVVRTWKRY